MKRTLLMILALVISSATHGYDRKTGAQFASMPS